MAYADLWGEKLTRELGSADTTELFTEARRKTAVNEAMVEFVKQTACLTQLLTLTVVDGTQEYDLDSAVTVAAADFLDVAPEGPTFKYTDTGGRITYLSGEDFPRKDELQMQDERIDFRNADSVSELPTSWYIREQGGSVYFGIVPIPDIGAGDSANVLVPYVCMPYPMTNDNDEPFSPAEGQAPKRTLRPWWPALVHYAAALLEPLRKGVAAEQAQRAKFAALVADYIQKKRPKNGQHIRLARNYYREQRGQMSSARVDPRIWP